MVHTSEWCKLEPVSHHGFVVQGLYAHTEYGPIVVRACNAVGESMSSNPVSVKTGSECRLGALARTHCWRWLTDTPLRHPVRRSCLRSRPPS